MLIVTANVTIGIQNRKAPSTIMSPKPKRVALTPHVTDGNMFDPRNCVHTPGRLCTHSLDWGCMVDRVDHLRAAVQKITEAIWNLDQLEPLSPELQVQYHGLPAIRAERMKFVKEK